MTEPTKTTDHANKHREHIIWRSITVKLIIGIALALFCITQLMPGFDVSDQGDEAITTMLYFIILGCATIFLWTRFFSTIKTNRLEMNFNEDLKNDVDRLKKAGNNLHDKATDANADNKPIKPERDLSELSAAPELSKER